jgi:hypothetical protein
MNLTITVFPNRKTPKGKEQNLTWEELVDRLSGPVVTAESLDEYKAMTNEERTEIKDVGGYVGGAFVDAKRSKDGLKFRSLLVIDADHATGHDVEDFELFYDTVFFCHTTHSSTPENPRLRWIFPLSRPVTPEEYRELTTAVVNWVGADSIDETTDQPERLMFWPSISRDGDWRQWGGGTEVLNPDDYIDADDYEPTISAPSKPEPSTVTLDGTLVVGEGQRNRTVFGFAASLRSQGLDRDGIRAIVEEYNDRYCTTPLPPAELDTIVRSVCSRYQPGEAIHPSLRDAWDDFNDLGEWKETEKQPVSMTMESATSLNSRYVAPPKYIVPGLLSNGLNIIASPPKFGKSWMMMDLAISVATGTEFLGMPVEQTGVIYLALEDGDHRLKDRMLKVAGGREIPDCLFFVESAPTLGDDLLRQLDAIIESAPCRIGLLIIDTLQKVRGVAGKTEGVYGYDYRELGKFKQFVDEKGLCGTFVHHLNKGGDDSDFVSRLNGSTGVSGAADTIITLTRAKRGDDTTKMSITGRDVTERTLVIQMDWSNYRWICLGDERDVERDADEYAFQNDPVVKTILYHLDEAEELLDPTQDVDQVEWVCTSSQLLSAVEALYGPQEGGTSNAVGMRVKKYQDKLASSYGISYEYRRRTNKREHVFTRELI